MRWKNIRRSGVSAGSLGLLLWSVMAPAQPACDDIRKSCLDHCHYAPQHQWSSGFKCKRECQKQVEACRRGMRGYGPGYGYGSRSGYGYGAAPGQPGTFGGYPAGAPPQQAAPYGYGAAPASPPAAGYGAPSARSERPFAGP